MNYDMSLKLGHIAQELIFKLLGMLGLRWAIVDHCGICLFKSAPFPDKAVYVNTTEVTYGSTFLAFRGS